MATTLISPLFNICIYFSIFFFFGFVVIIVVRLPLIRSVTAVGIHSHTLNSVCIPQSMSEKNSAGIFYWFHVTRNQKKKFSALLADPLFLSFYTPTYTYIDTAIYRYSIICMHVWECDCIADPIELRTHELFKYIYIPAILRSNDALVSPSECYVFRALFVSIGYRPNEWADRWVNASLKYWNDDRTPRWYVNMSKNMYIFTRI